MKIGIIATNTIWGGSEELWVKMAHAALQEGHEVLLSVYNYSPVPLKIQELINKGAKSIVQQRTFKYPKRSFVKKVIHRLTATAPVVEITSPYEDFFNNKVDLLFVNQGGTFNVMFDESLFKHIQKIDVPYFLMSQFYYEYQNVLPASMLEETRTLFDKAAKIFFVSQRNLESAKRHLYSHLTNAVVVRNPVNMTDNSLVTYSSMSDVLHMATVGRYEINYKGQDLLFQVLAAEQWRNRKWNLHLYGSGPDEMYLKKLASFYGIQDKVIFEGHVNNVRDIWGKNHLLVMPSVGEGTPLAMVEAMLCGRAAVVTDVAGHREWIEEGKTGFIAEAPSVLYLTAAMERAWTNRQAWKSMGETARDKALTQYDPDSGMTILKYMLSHA